MPELAHLIVILVVLAEVRLLKDVSGWAGRLSVAALALLQARARSVGILLIVRVARLHVTGALPLIVVEVTLLLEA